MIIDVHPGHAPRSVSTGRARAAANPTILDAIDDPDVDLVIWRRGLPEPLTAYARAVADSTFDSILNDAGLPHEPLPDGDGRAALLDDVRGLAAAFARRCAGRAFDGELEAIRDDKCRRFHVDYHALRLVCTYAGPGTEWVARDDVDRRKLAARHLELEAAHRAAGVRPTDVRRLAPGDVLLMKGKGWPGAHGPVHRSPPVEAAGQRRLVLTLTLR